VLAYAVEQDQAQLLGITLGDRDAALALDRRGQVLLSHAANGLYRHDLSRVPATSERVGDAAPRAGTALVLSDDERFAAAFGRSPTVVY
jgi:hypothetical protein